MIFWDYSRSAASARLMVDFGREHGVSPASVLSGAKLALAHLDDPNVELSAGQELRIVLNLLRALKSPAGFGVHLGARYRLSTYGIWGYGVICAATVRDSMAFSIRYLPLTYAFTGVRFREVGDLVEVSFGAPDLAGGIAAFLVQRDMAATASLMREVQGSGFRLVRFAFAGAQPADWRQLSSSIARNFGVSPEFGAASNHLAFDRSRMDLPLLQANPLTFAICEQSCERLLEKRRARRGTAAMIRQFLDAAPVESSYHLESIARLLHTSERTLKRRLRDEGTTFTVLLAEHRAALAEELLREGGLTSTQIATRLGFSDLSTFSQAFKRWFGVSPRNFQLADTGSRPIR